MDIYLKNNKLIILILIASLFLNFIGIWWGLPNKVSWSKDAIGPMEPLQQAYHGFHLNKKYPPLHYLITDIFYSPYLVYLYFKGEIQSLHTLFEHEFIDNINHLTILMYIQRSISALMGVIIVYLIYRISKEVYNNEISALFSAAIVALSPAIILFSHVENVDIPVSFWFSLSLFFYLRVLKNFELKYYVLLGIFSACAISTKEQILPAFILMFPYILYKQQPYRQSNAKIFNNKIAIGIFFFLGTFIFLNIVLTGLDAFIYRLSLWLGPGRRLTTNIFPNSISGQIAVFLSVMYKLSASNGESFFFVSIIGAYLTIKSERERGMPIFVVLVSYYIFLLAFIRYVAARFTIPLILLFAIFGGRGLYFFYSNVKFNKSLTHFIIFLFFIFPLSQAILIDLFLINDSRYAAEKWMIQNVHKDSDIETYQSLTYLPRLDILGFKPATLVFPVNIGYSKNVFEDLYSPYSEEALEVRSPEFIIFTDTVYFRFKDDINKKYFDSLINGSLGYKVVKQFKTGSYPLYVRLLEIDGRVNPKIMILAKP
jgi:hypothetical protein